MTERGRKGEPDWRKKPCAYLCTPLYLPLKYQRVMFGAFCHPGFNTKQLDGFVGQQEDKVFPLGLMHPKSAHQSPDLLCLGLLLGNSVRMPTLMKPDAGQFSFSTLNNQVKPCEILSVSLILYGSVCVCVSVSVVPCVKPCMKVITSLEWTSVKTWGCNYAPIE